jgi:DNA-binding NarL/FixJ family response regulator
MTVSPTAAEAGQAIAVVLIDDDIIFRTGFRVWLSQQEGVTVVGEADRERSALEMLESAIATAEDTAAESRSVAGVIGLEIAYAPDMAQGGIQLCRVLGDRLPTVPFLLVGNPMSAAVLEQMREAGAQGYGLKSENPDILLQRLRQLATGESAWEGDGILAVSPGQDSEMAEVRRAIATPFALFKRNLRRSGIRQIDGTLADLLAQLNHPDLEDLDRLFLEGRCRELRVARWMVRRILATVELDAVEPEAPEPTEPLSESKTDPSRSLRPRSESESSRALPNGSPRLMPEPTGSAIISAGVEATLFEGVTLKLQSSLRNFSQGPLEIDILREDKKRELLYLVVRKWIDLLGTRLQSQVTPRQLQERRSPIFRDLWNSIADDYFGKYYAVQVETLEVEVVTVLQDDAATAQAEILDRIPYSYELLAHLLFQDPLLVDSVPQAAGTPEAMMRAEVLLDHFIIQAANSIIQPLLNRLGDVEVIKQSFYDRSLLSSRDLAQFRNNLSWRYRFDRTIGDPVHIFESRYRLFVLQGNGIKQTSIYAPRRDELDALQGFPFLVTLALEFRDAVAPRVRAVISFVGSGLIYVLTEVIGRGIGLVVRGVIKGIGNAWQETRFSRDAGQRRL